jgi:hypothetical protein
MHRVQPSRIPNDPRRSVQEEHLSDVNARCFGYRCRSVAEGSCPNFSASHATVAKRIGVLSDAEALWLNRVIVQLLGVA